jgi:hypothetical protein
VLRGSQGEGKWVAKGLDDGGRRRKGDEQVRRGEGGSCGGAQREEGESVGGG